jgi:hypothetical protein
LLRPRRTGKKKWLKRKKYLNIEEKE